MTAQSQLPDGIVVQRVLRGEAELFGILVERYRAEFGRYAVALLGDPDAAADAMQEAFIRAFDALAGCRNPHRFKAWFFRILTNQCHNVRERGGRRELDITVVDPPAAEGADRALDRSELEARIGQALAALTPEQREAFVLKHVEGRSYEEMAELLGTGVDALKMRVYRARDALRALLGDLA